MDDTKSNCWIIWCSKTCYHKAFEDKELDKNSVCSKMEHTATDGKKYQTEYYNLDAIISVGYRVNSIRATQFRRWATNILKTFTIQSNLYL